MSLFIKHMKAEHYDKVKECKKYKEGNCSFYENCWFKQAEVDKKKKKKMKRMKKLMMKIMLK